MKKIKFCIIGGLIIAAVSCLYAGAVFAQESTTYPYKKKFIISAYYSPLPDQKHYYTGAYKSEIRLNGRGTNGASGRQVYPGMVAAPKSYAFGTKMNIPGVGIVAVQDRGGAIRSADGKRRKYDRLDIWMGKGHLRGG